MNAMRQLEPEVVQFLRDNGLELEGSSHGFFDKFGAFCVRGAFSQGLETAEKIKTLFESRQPGIQL